MMPLKTQIKKSILLLLILLSGYISCQNKDLKQIDSLLKKADYFNKKFQDLNEFTTARKANILAKKINNSERKARSSYYISRSLFNLGLQKESLAHINSATSDGYITKDPLLNSLFIELKGYIYKFMNLKSQGIFQFNKIFNILKNENSQKAYEIRARTYANLAQMTSDKDSAYTYFQLQAKQLQKLSEKKYFNAICEHYSYLGGNYLERNDFDSALNYFEKALKLKKKYNDPVLYEQYKDFGSYYIYKNNYQKALDYFLKAKENMQHYIYQPSYYAFIDAQISYSYAKLGNKEMYEKYENLIAKNNAKIQKEQDHNMDYALHVILKDQKRDQEESNKQQYIYILVGIIALSLIFFLVFIVLRKNLKHKDNIISEVTHTLQEKNKIINLKSQETEELQQKINHSYTELVELAKNNDPDFYFIFQNAYPNFQKKMLTEFPGLRNSELILCAYTFLGFSIKDIADYTYKSINTIRNRKQNLRKKFNIPTEQDMGFWLRNFINPQKEN